LVSVTEAKTADRLFLLLGPHSPKLKSNELDRLFDPRSRKSVRRMLIGPERARRAPGGMAFRQLASGRIAGKRVQIGACFRGEHIDEHDGAFAKMTIDGTWFSERIAK
jgi:hypothetical protein